MDANWGPAAIVGAASLIGNAVIAFRANERRAGQDAEKLKSHGARIVALEGEVGNHETRIGRLEGWRDAQ